MRSEAKKKKVHFQTWEGSPWLGESKIIPKGPQVKRVEKRNGADLGAPWKDKSRNGWGEVPFSL